MYSAAFPSEKLLFSRFPKNLVPVQTYSAQKSKECDIGPSVRGVSSVSQFWGIAL